MCYLLKVVSIEERERIFREDFLTSTPIARFIIFLQYPLARYLKDSFSTCCNLLNQSINQSKNASNHQTPTPPWISSFNNNDKSSIRTYLTQPNPTSTSTSTSTYPPKSLVLPFAAHISHPVLTSHISLPYSQGKKALIIIVSSSPTHGPVRHPIPSHPIPPHHTTSPNCLLIY